MIEPQSQQQSQSSQFPRAVGVADREPADAGDARDEPRRSAEEDFGALPELELRADNHYHLRELLRYNDREFVRTAYRVTLGREPDEEGMAHHLSSLRLGRVNKTDVVESLRHSPEGEARGATIKGLKPRAVRRLRHVPYLGYVIRWFSAAIRLPDLLQAYLNNSFSAQPTADDSSAPAASFSARQLVNYRLEIDDELRELKELVADAADSVKMLAEMVAGTPEVRALEADLGAVRREAEEGLTSARRSITQAEGDLSRITAEIIQWQKLQDALFQEQRSNAAFFQELLIQEQRVIVDTQRTAYGALRDRFEELREEQRRLGLQFRLYEDKFRALLSDAKSAAAIGEDDRARVPDARALDAEARHHLDGLLASFEGHFRGGREEVRERLSYYLPYLSGAARIEVGASQSPVLDIGCGRGEWLGILRENNLAARGVDSNRVLVAECAAAGLDVSEADAIEALRACPNASLGAVTGFHIIEHLPFEALIELLDQAVRAVRPGGLVIFETPNPKNLVVAACNFYADPTHQRPVYPETIQFLMQHRGLTDVRVEYLHPVETNLFAEARQQQQSDGRQMDTWFNWFYGHRDYAVIGRRL